MTSILDIQICGSSRILSCRLFYLVSASLIAAVVAQPARAQEAATQSADPASNEIVVTAQKREESLQKVPISIAVLSGQALDKQTSGGSLAALALVPGIGMTTSDTGGQTQLSMRGVAPAGYFASGTATVAYYLDSVPFQFARNAIVPSAKTYDLSRIEVLRGPQGTLYGASALNGVVRVLTNDADASRWEFKARGGISFTEGGDPSFRADAAVNIPLIEDKLAIRVVGGLERQGGWVEQPVLNKNNANSSASENLRIKLAWTPTDNLRIDLGAWFDHTEYDASNYSDLLGNQYTPSPYGGENSFNIYSAKITYDLPAVTITSSTSYMKFRQTMTNDASFLAPAARPFAQGYFRLPARLFSEEVLLNTNGSGPWRASLGLFYRNASDERYQTLPPIVVGTVYWKEFQRSYAAFGQVARTFADGEFELSGGLRYFKQDGSTEVPAIAGATLAPSIVKVSSEKVTPRVVATWLPSSDFTAYASYAQGFRAGLNQMPLTLRVAAIPDVKSDTLHNYEIGMKGKLLDSTISYDVALYYIKWVDAQTSVGILYGPVGAQGQVAGLINGPSASGFGTDVSLRVQPATGLQLGASVSYNDLKWDGDVTSGTAVLYSKGDQLAFSPKLSAEGFMSYSFPLSDNVDGLLKVSANYRSKMSFAVSGIAACGTGIALCYSEAPFYINANFDIISASGKTLSIFGTNLNNWNGLLQPASTQTTTFRPRPRTIGVQFEAKF